MPANSCRAMSPAVFENRSLYSVKPSMSNRSRLNDSAAAAGAEDLFFELIVEVSGIVKMRQRIEESV